MADLTRSPLPPRKPSRLTGTYSPRPLVAVMGLGAIFPMSALTFVLLLPEMQDAYHQGLSLLALLAVQQLQTGLGPDFVLALAANQTSRTRVLVGAGGFFTAAAAVLWLAGVFPNQILLYAGAIGVVLGGGALTSTQNSLLCDYYPVSLRPRVILAQRAALVFGLTLCPLMEGTLAYAFGWQASFFVLAAAALVFVVLAARLPDPVPAGGLPGGDPDRPEPPDEPATVPEAARVIATTRSLRLIYYSLPFLLGTVLGLTFYATAYYENVFHQDAAHRGCSSAWPSREQSSASSSPWRSFPGASPPTRGRRCEQSPGWPWLPPPEQPAWPWRPMWPRPMPRSWSSPAPLPW